MKLYGLIGYPLGHSFSKRYFTEKFERLGIPDAQYELFPLDSIQLLEKLLRDKPEIVGLNVTIPYKEAIIPYLDEIDEASKDIGAINVIKIKNGKKIGYNTDYIGFSQSLLRFLPQDWCGKALILGSGGSAKAVQSALRPLKIPFQLVSRNKNQALFSYSDLNETLLQEYTLIINTTPVGMYPIVEQSPDIPYQFVSNDHYLFDLVYNPVETLFLQKGKAKGAHVTNGLEMLYLQAEAAWKIWNEF
jgi:shikimate dehydrogenase